MKVLLTFVLTIFLLFPAYSQQDKILEKVEIDWWVIPMFAIDSSGKAVKNLTESDIEIVINKKKIDNFVLVKKNFSAAKQKKIEAQAVQSEASAPIERQKNVILLFDTALSTVESTEKARIIARKIVTDAEENSLFYIMSINPFAGLEFLGGQTNDKAVLKSIISQKVIPRKNIRVPSYKEIVEQVGGKNLKYDESDLGFLTQRATKYHVRKSLSFTKSFKTLYYILKNIKDNKFVYLFSEGVSRALQYSDAGSETVYRIYFKQLSDYLGRSGAVLFIINSFGTTINDDVAFSGEDSLRFIAKESGGKYLEGTDTNVINTLENIHKAYYEVFFPANIKAKTGILNITVNSKQKGVEIQTIRTAEKSKKYASMEPMEREIMALNLISGSTLVESNLTINNIKIENTSTMENQVIYRVIVPDGYFQQSLDLYKVRMNEKGEDTNVEKETLSFAPRNLNITFDNLKEGQDTYFVLVNSKRNSALIYGKAKPKEEFQVVLPQDEEEWATKELLAKERKELDKADAERLNILLKGTAVYCEKLKKAAFHYICKEKIIETQEPFSRTRGPNSGDLSFSEPQDETLYQRQVVNDQKSSRIITKTTIEKRAFSYRLIKSGDNIKEERDLSKDEDDSSKKKKKSKEPLTIKEAVKRIRFLSSKSVFGPITLLAAERQEKYNFRLVGDADLQGRKAAIIEALPKNESDSLFIYGKVWIDKENFSILKIKANPNSIVGYSRLKKFADQLNTKLYLELETEFFTFRDGICFPTSIHFKETYKGGPFVTSRRGSKGWKRTDTLTQYTDYTFFDVKSEVTY